LKLTVGAVRCFIALGQPDQAAEFLQSAADRAPSDKESRELLRIREKLIQQTVG